MLNIIKYDGLNDLTDQEANTIKIIAEKNFPKIKRVLNNDLNLFIKIKVYKKGNAKKKYSAHLRVEAPTQIFATHDSDWDLAKVIHSITEKAITEIQHHLKKTRKDDFKLKRILRKAKKVRTTI